MQVVKRDIKALQQVKPLSALAAAAVRFYSGQSRDNAAFTRIVGALGPEGALLFKQAGLSPEEWKQFHHHGTGLTAAALQMLARTIIQLQLPQSFTETTPGTVKQTGFWKAAFTCAAYARRLAEALDSPCQAEAWLAGLLLDSGRLALDLVAPDGYSKALQIVKNEGVHLLEAERRELGVDHALAGKWLAEAWDLPDTCIAAIWLHHHPVKSLPPKAYPIDLIEIVGLADLLARRPMVGTLGQGRVPAAADERAQRLGLNRDTLKAIVSTPVAMPAPESVVQTTSQGITADHTRAQEIIQLRDTVQFLQRLRNSYQVLEQAARPNDVLSVMADTLQQVFGIVTGLCVVIDEEAGVADGRSWTAADAIPRELSIALQELEGPHEQQVGSALMTILAAMQQPEVEETSALPVSRYGLTAIPIQGTTDFLGQIIFENTRGAYRESPGDFEDLVGFAHACGAFLERCLREEKLRLETEELVQALSAQVVQHEDALRLERLSSVGEMAAGAAHEINNPLAIISGRAQMLLNHVTAQEDLDALEAIIQQSRRAAKILADLMQFARPADPHLKPAVASKVLHQVAAMLKGRLESKGISLVEEYDTKVPQIPMDRRQIEQVFANIILNAEQAMADHGGTLTLRVRASQDHRGAVIQVIDTGAGIPSNVIGRVFEPFFTTRKEGEGTGLGLSVCRGLITIHRGTITLHSVDGQGTTCTITLPASREEALDIPKAPLETTKQPKSPIAATTSAQPEEKPPIQEPVERPTPEQKPVILLAERDDDLRLVLQESLQNRGYITTSVGDGLEAMAAVLGKKIDLVLLDLGLTGVHGEPILHQIRERSKTLPVIALAAFGSEDHIEDAKRLGIAACLEKPFELSRLIKLIETALRSRNVA